MKLCSLRPPTCFVVHYNDICPRCTLAYACINQLAMCAETNIPRSQGEMGERWKAYPVFC